MKRSTLPRSGRRLATKGAAAVLATATAATVAGMTITPAQSATGSACPAAYPVNELTANQDVTGLTVTKGTDPGEFTGRVLGVLDNGIMPGMDMILVRLGSDTSGVDKRIFDVGIWAGMSGSPVYAADGRLIGAVSYGLSYGPSTVAGVTPAADMRQLLAAGADPAPAPQDGVDIPARLEDRVVASGAATRAQVDEGMSELNVLGMSGLSKSRFRQVTKKLDLPKAQRMTMGTTAAEGSSASSIVAGGNVAAAVSYGDVSFAGVGTATMVCAAEVVGFGHPMMWGGPTGLSLHPAEAIYVQEDPAWAGFKVANVGAPVGTINQDRMAGIAGFLGDVPEPSTITSHVSTETRDRTGRTFVNLPTWVPDIALSHLLSNEDAAFDGVGKGSGTVGYTVNGTREDGTPFSVDRSDVYASEYDLTWETAWDLYMTLSQLEYNQAEDVTITDLTTDSDLTRDYVHAAIDKVSVRQGDAWVPLTRNSKVVLVAGETARFKVDLVTSGGGPTSVKIGMPVAKKDAGKRGYLEVVGGNSTRTRFGGRNMTLDKLLASIDGAPHNDDVIVGAHLFPMRESQRTTNREVRGTTDGVPVDGSVGARLRIVG